VTLQEQIEKLAELRDGWAGDHSKAMSPVALEKARMLVGSIQAVPTYTGGISFEVHALGFDAEVEIDQHGLLSLYVGFMAQKVDLG